MRPYREILHMSTAVLWASRSTCKRAKCGAVLTTGDMRQVKAIGYNGPGAGLPDDRCNGAEGSCGCLHAETNALLRGKGEVLFTTSAPCQMCAQQILGAGIQRVVYSIRYRDETGINLLATRVHVERITLEEISEFLYLSGQLSHSTLKLQG